MTDTRRFTPVLLLVTLAFAAVRLLALAGAPLEVYNNDELHTGVIAHELLVGLAFPVLDYQYVDYNGGSLVEGILGVPFFAALGSSFVALKLLALSFAVATFLVWMRLFERTIGQGGALAAGLFWTFAPIVHLRLALVAWGLHTESSLFTGLMLLFFFGGLGLERKEGAPSALVTGDDRRTGRLFLAGLVAGFSVYFCYTSLGGIATLWLFWCWLDRSLLPRRGVVWFLAGAALGFTPWLVYNLPRGFGGLILHTRGVHQHFLPSGIGAMIAKARNLFALDLPRSLAPPAELGLLRPLGALAITLVVAAAAIAALAALVRARAAAPGRHGVPATACFLLYVAVYTVAYALCDLGTFPDRFGVYAYRFFAPLLPFFAAIVGAGVVARPRLRALLAIPLALSLASIAGSFAVARPGELHWAGYRGYSYRMLGLRMGFLEIRDLDDTLARAERIADPGDRRFCLETLFAGALRRHLGGLHPARGLAAAAALAELRWVESQRPSLIDSGRRALDAEIRFRSLTGQLGPLDWDDWLAAGAGSGRAGALAVNLCAQGTEEARGAARRVSSLPPDLRAGAAEGIGICAALLSREGLDQELEPALRADFYRGLGAYNLWLVEGLEEYPARFLDRVPAGNRRDYVLGVRAKIEEVEAEDPVRRDDLLRRATVQAGYGSLPLGCPARR